MRLTIEKSELHATVREGYQLLLRADAELYLPIDRPKMLDFYKRMAETCMRWAREVYGEGLRKSFAELESIRERSQFRTQRYRLCIHTPWQEGQYAVFLCESELLGQWREPQKSYHRISHVWNTEEELILPFSQILRNFGLRLTKDMMPFHPDGIYPTEKEMVFFRNVSDHTPFLEKKIERESNKEVAQRK